MILKRSTRKLWGCMANWSRVSCSNNKYRGIYRSKLINNLIECIISKMHWTKRGNEEEKMRETESRSMLRPMSWGKKMLTFEKWLHRSSPIKQTKSWKQRMKNWDRLLPSWKCSFSKRIQWLRKSNKKKWIQCSNWMNFKDKHRASKQKWKDIIVKKKKRRSKEIKWTNI